MTKLAQYLMSDGSKNLKILELSYYKNFSLDFHDSIIEGG
jgi:hypothetical protein